MYVAECYIFPLLSLPLSLPLLLYLSTPPPPPLYLFHHKIYFTASLTSSLDLVMNECGPPLWAGLGDGLGATSGLFRLELGGVVAMEMDIRVTLSRLAER